MDRDFCNNRLVKLGLYFDIFVEFLFFFIFLVFKLVMLTKILVIISTNIFVILTNLDWLIVQTM